MDDCRRTADRLTLYVDGELPPPEHGAVEAHLAACPDCRRHAGAEAGARTVLRAREAALRGTPLPPGLRTRCEAMARRRPAHGGVPWPRRAVSVALVTLVLLFAGTISLSLATSRSTTVLAAQLTADHLKCFGVFVPADAPGAEASVVARMLLDRYGYDVPVPPSSAEAGLELVGARRCLYAEGYMPHLLYRVGGQDVSLFVLDSETRTEATLISLGHRSNVWSIGANTFVLVAPAGEGGLDEAELARVEGYVRAQLE
jgi:anti-sigma factor RsiW